VTGPRLLRALVAVVAFAAVLSGCASAGAGGARIQFSRFGDGMAQPVGVLLTGLEPSQPVVVTARAHTGTGDLSSRAVYAVPPDGRVQLWSQEPISAPYPRPDGAGLLWSLVGPSLSQRQLERQWVYGALDLRFTAEQGGRVVATADLNRTPLAAGTSDREILGSDLIGTGAPESSGLAPSAQVGTLVMSVPTPVELRPGVIVVDGDADGGSGAFAAHEIAAAGFPVFVLPAFVPEGRIAGSAALSVETFDASLNWFSALPIVDADRVFVYGTGPSSSLALWFASHEPARVHGVFAASGATAMQCTSEAGSPLLIQNGLPLPCANPDRTIAGTDLLPLQRVSGPVVLACGTADRLLPTACDWTRAGERVRGTRDGDAFLYARGADHEISTPPELPIGLSELPPATAQATEDARVAFWQLVLARLAGAIRP
jgi:dienelactone hydrolase